MSNKTIQILKDKRDGSIFLKDGVHLKTVWRGPLNEIDNVADGIQASLHFTLPEGVNAIVSTIE